MAIVLKEETTLNNKCKKYEKLKETIREKSMLLSKKRREKEDFYKAIFNQKIKIPKLISVSLNVILAIVMLIIFIFFSFEIAIIPLILFIFNNIIFSIAKIFLKNKTNKTPYNNKDEIQLLEEEISILEDELWNIKPLEEEIKGNEGEQEVIEYIIQNFNDTYFLYNDIKVPYIDDYGGRTTTQIDHILICNRGVFCLETKNLASGKYWPHNTKKWYYKNNLEIDSPQNQAKFHKFKLKNYLDYIVPIFPVVILTNEDCVFNADKDENFGKVLHANELKKYIESKPIKINQETINKVIEEINLLIKEK